MTTTRKFAKALHREVTRVAFLIAIGVALIVYTPALALQLGEPALSPWGLFIGGSFMVAAVSHIMRRAFFSRLDLQSIAIKAITERNSQAAAVFLGIIAVLITFILVNGSLLRM